MFERGVSFLTVSVAFGVFVFVLPGGVRVTTAAKKCGFNGDRTYVSGDLVLRVEEACTSFYCKPKVNKKGKLSKKHVEIYAQTDSLDSCSCNIASRYTTDSKTVVFNGNSFPRSIHRVGKRDVPDPFQVKGMPKILPKSRPVRRISKEKGDQNRVNQFPRRLARRRKGGRPRAGKSRRKCKYNKKRFKAGQIITSVPSRCLDLLCVKESKRVSVIKVQFQESCSCSDSGGSGGGNDGSTTGKCSDYQEKYSSSHSMCKPQSSTCKINSKGVTDAEKKKILRIHNEYRAKVANGEEKRGSPGPQPSASNMQELVWKQELADVAQAWANTCPNGHDCNECRRLLGEDYFVGQNLYWSWSFSQDEEWNTALTAFYDEVEYVPKSLVDNYQSIITVSQIGHYTQLVWGESSEVGCGAIKHGPCSSGLVSYQVCKTYVCNYGPAGNFLGRPIYKEGSAASDCPNEKSKKYDGLCK